MGAIGFYQSFDSRYDKAVAAKTGGLSQATTYVAGCAFLSLRRMQHTGLIVHSTVSGGCISTMALAINDFVDVQTLVAGGAFNNSGNVHCVLDIVQTAHDFTRL